MEAGDARIDSASRRFSGRNKTNAARALLSLTGPAVV